MMVKNATPPANARRIPLNGEFAVSNQSRGLRQAAGEIGAEGLRAFYGHITETYITQLEWPRAYDTYNEMRRRDPTLRSMLNAIKMLSRQSVWKAQSASDSPADRQAAEFVDECLGDISHTVEDFIDDVYTFLPFGWSSFEIVYKRRNGMRSLLTDNKIGWRKFAFRRQSSFDRWEFDDTGGFGGWYQRPAPDYKEIYLPPEELLHFVGERDGNNPEGISIFESAYEPWHFVKNLQIISGIGWQRTFVGLPVFSFEGTPSNDDKAAVQEVGEGLTVDEKQFVSLPPGVKFDLASVANSSAGALLDTIKMYRALMLQITLSEFIMMALLGTGSFSQHADKTDLFMMAVNGYLDKIAAIWSQFGVKRLFELEANRIPGMTAPPTITHSEVRKPQLDTLGQFIQQIGSYIKITGEDEIWIRDQAGMPIVEQQTDAQNKPDTIGINADTPENIESTAGLNGTQINAVINVLEQLRNGVVSDVVAIELILAVGIENLRAQRMVESVSKLQTIKSDMTASEYASIISQVLADLKENDNAISS